MSGNGPTTHLCPRCEGSGFLWEASGEMCRKIRENAGISQAQLAESAGVDHSLVSHVEADRRTPPPALRNAYREIYEAVLENP